VPVILFYIRYYNMSNNKSTTDNAHSSQAAAPQKRGSGIADKIGGVGNVIHGTGEVIRGHALGTGHFGHSRGDGTEITAAGRDEVERGLNRIEGKPIAASATGHDQDQDQHGVDDGTGAAPGHGPNTAPQATAAPRADPTSGKADTGYIGDRGTGGVAANGTHDPSPEQYHGKQSAATAPPRDPLGAGDSRGVPNTDVRQQGNGIAPGDRGKETRATADASDPADAAGQQQPSGLASQA